MNELYSENSITRPFECSNVKQLLITGARNEREGEQVKDQILKSSPQAKGQ